MAVAGYQGVGLDVVLVGGPAGGVTKNGRRCPDMCGILDGQGGGGRVAKEMGIDRDTERCLRPPDDRLADRVRCERLARGTDP